MTPDNLKGMRPTPAGGAIDDVGELAATESPISGPWYTHAGFWRAVAGMALAIAAACIVVTLEISSELSSRSASYHRRIHQLSSRLATADQKIAAMRGEALARDSLTRILAASDVRLMRLSPIDGAAKASATVAISRKLSRAVLEVQGLPPTPAGQTYRLWWTLEHGSTVAAAQFQTRIDWGAIVSAQLPSGGDSIAAALVTAEPEKAPGRPTGTVKLRSLSTPGRSTSHNR